MIERMCNVYVLCTFDRLYVKIPLIDCKCTSVNIDAYTFDTIVCIHLIDCNCK